MSRTKFKEEDLKVRVSITINSKLSQIVSETIKNKSKYIEYLILQYLNKNNQLKDM